MLVLVRLFKGGYRTVLLLLLEDVLGAGTSPSVDDVSPVLSCVSRKLLPPEEHQQFSDCQTKAFMSLFMNMRLSHLLTKRTQALQISPERLGQADGRRKQDWKQ